MEKSAIELLQRVASDFSRRDATHLRTYFEFPCPIFFGGDLQLMTNPVDATFETKRYLNDLARNGVRQASIASVETVFVSATRSGLRVMWRYEDGGGNCLAATQNDIYFRRSDDGKTKISQIDIHVSSNTVMRSRFNAEESTFQC